jgi:2-isopropylmalate synthase
LGKHSGRAALKNKIAEWQIDMTDEDFALCFESFKSLCDRKKNVTEEDLLTLINEQTQTSATYFATLISFNTTQRGPGKYDADVTLQIDNQARQIVASGDGPLDALFQAVSQATQCSANLSSFEVHSVSEGCDAQAEATIVITDNGIHYTGHARDTDTIMAAARAYVGAINKFIAQKHNATPRIIAEKSYA